MKVGDKCLLDNKWKVIIQEIINEEVYLVSDERGDRSKFQVYSKRLIKI